MTVNGIIAEYNPFHSGHQYLMTEARNRTEADYTIVIMSGNYVQRGAPAVIDKHARARMALSCGADLVLELPVLYATSSAEAFASGAVSLLDGLGVVTHLCFGSECGETEPLLAIAEFLLKEPDEYRHALKRFLKSGFSYPHARARALAECGPQETDCGEILSSPNNILGIDYCKALLARKSAIQSVTVKRLGLGYHEKLPENPLSGEPVSGEPVSGEFASRELVSGKLASGESVSGKLASGKPVSGKLVSGEPVSGKLVSGEPVSGKPGSGEPAFEGSASGEPISAFAIREALYSGADNSYLTYMPEAAGKLLTAYLAQKSPVRPDDFSDILYYRLLLERETGYGKYLDLSEALSDRIQNHLSQFTGYDAFCNLLKTKDRTYTRISRCLLHILLGIEKEHMECGKSLGDAPYAKVLGFRRAAIPLLGAIKKHSSVPLISKLADAQKNLSSDAGRLLKLDLFGDELYNKISAGQSGMSPANEFTTPLIIQ